MPTSDYCNMIEIKDKIEKQSTNQLFNYNCLISWSLYEN